jgi:L-ascorbate metabolism protein UlaG (beta-lactamase superfamily)
MIKNIDGKTLLSGPKERVGWGAIGFEIRLDDKSLVNLGDTLLQQEAWEHIKEPDVQMIPIGGKLIHNTMDEKEALQAVEVMQPHLVIPCHYNCPAFFTTKYNPDDDRMFKDEVEKRGSKCFLLGRGESLSRN